MTDLILPVFTNAITLEQVRAANAETIFYGALTPWWTHDPEHLGNPGGIPCDPSGGVLFQAPANPWLGSAASSPVHYGKHEMRALMAAHHLNCQTPDGRPWCMQGWLAYNEMLDRFDAQQEG